MSTLLKEVKSADEIYVIDALNLPTDDVVILNASDFIATIRENIPHENALPDNSNQAPILK